FFFSSRRRHTRSKRDWSSDVCSSDLGAIISKYEAAFAAVPLLVSFIPMLMDTGGNCGSQSSTLIIRGLAVDELHFADAAKVIWRSEERRVGKEGRSRGGGEH